MAIHPSELDVLQPNVQDSVTYYMTIKFNVSKIRTFFMLLQTFGLIEIICLKLY